MKAKRYITMMGMAAALLLCLGGCVKYDLHPNNGLLSEGAEVTPIVFTATWPNFTDTTTAASTRATVDGNWKDVTASVAVMIDSTVKEYTVWATATDNYMSAMLISDDPHYWTDSYDDITVTAWWPYTEGDTTLPDVVVNADQSTLEKFEANYSITAKDQTVSYNNPTLTFTNRTARVIIEVTDYTGEPKSVKLTNLSDDNGNPTDIVPYKYDEESYTYTYIALVAPQTVAANTTFISGEFNNGDTFNYNMQQDTTWNAGMEYTYTVSPSSSPRLQLQ